MAEISKPLDLSRTWARIGDVREPSDAKKDTGWVKEIPTFQDFNWVLNREDTAIAHINQHGIPVWDASTEYIILKSLVQGSNGNIYSCIATNTGTDPVTDTSNTVWELYLVLAKKSKAKVTLSTINGWANVSAAISAEIICGVLHVHGNITGGTITDGTAVANLSASYRPSVEKYSTGTYIHSGVYKNCLVTIKTNGDVTITGVTALTNLFIHAVVVI
jgi:hypothetical protein